MRKFLALPALLVMMASVAAGCGSTPEPTEPPPTQTPWIIVVTATPGTESAARVESTPAVVTVVVTATPTPRRQATQEPPPTQRASESPEATAQATETSAPPSPTVSKPAASTPTPEPVDIQYQAPALLEPPNNLPVSWKSTVLLKWSSVAELADDEYYHVHLERPPKTEGEQWYGDFIFTKGTELLLERSFLAPFHLAQEHGHAVVYWWVRVVRQTGVDENGKPIGMDIGEHSEKRTLILEPKP